MHRKIDTKARVCAHISTGQSEGVGGAMRGNYTLCRREHGKKKEEKTQKTDGLIT